MSDRPSLYIPERPGQGVALDDEATSLASAIVAAASEALLVADDDRRYVAANPAACALLGRSHDELLGMRVDDLATPDERAWVPTAWAAFIADGVQEGPMVIVRPDGTTRHVEYRAKAHIAPGRHLSSLVDVTERVLTERDLRARLAAEVEAGYHAAFESLTDAVLMLRAVRDETGTIVDEEIVAANAAWRQAILGDADVPDLAGTRLLERFPHFADRFALHAQVIETGRPFRALMTVPGGTGMFDTDYAVLGDGVIAVSRDVTEAHQAREALARAEAELREAQRIAHVGSWTFDAATGSVQWSEELFRIMALPVIHGPIPRDAQPDLFAPLSPEVREARAAALDRTMATGEPFEIRFDIERPDGTTRRAISRGEAARDAEGRITGARGTVADVTELHELEERLRQAQRLETVGRLAGGIAHDFNNLLAAINGSADFIARSLPPGSPVAGDVEQILSTTERAAALTRQLLLFGRRLPVNPEVMDVAHAIDGLVPMLQRVLGEHIELTTVRGPRVGHVRIDRTHLEQIVVNLAVNARDAMPDGGGLRISTSLVPALSEPGSATRPAVRVEITDTGLGMDEGTVARIFDPFFTTKELGRGTGLGLATVHGIVQQAGGVIRVRSTPGAGTTFEIDFPRADEPLPADEVAPVPSATLAEPRAAVPGVTILLVEDDAIIRRGLARTLGLFGHAVIEAGAPAEALALDDQVLASVDLLLTDMLMPGMNGARLADELQARRPGLRCLLMSGYTPEALMDGHAGTAVLAKPFTSASLARALSDALA